MAKFRIRKVVFSLLKATLVLFMLCVGVVLVLRFVAPPVSALMIERRVESWQHPQPYTPKYDWVSLDKMAPAMEVAVIASEDQNFFRHHGFDWGAIEKAVDYNERAKRVRGASTLTQQTAKNLFLWPGRDWTRKGVEAFFTVLMETCWSKPHILETYLNIVEFGNGVFGVEAAARKYFHKPASRLTAAEAALLAAVLPNPHQLRVDAPSAYVRERQQWILQQMSQIGGIS